MVDVVEVPSLIVYPNDWATNLSLEYLVADMEICLGWDLE